MVSYRLCWVRCRGNSTVAYQLYYSVTAIRFDTKRHVADLSVTAIRQTSDTLKLERRLIAEQDLGSILYCSSSSVDKFLSLS